MELSVYLEIPDSRLHSFFLPLTFPTAVMAIHYFDATEVAIANTCQLTEAGLISLNIHQSVMSRAIKNASVLNK